MTYGYTTSTKVRNEAKDDRLLLFLSPNNPYWGLKKYQQSAAGKEIGVTEVPLQTWVGALSGVLGPRAALEFGEMLNVHFELGCEWPYSLAALFGIHLALALSLPAPYQHQHPRVPAFFLCGERR